MNKRAIKYCDTYAAPGSELYRILTEEPQATREHKAKRHYDALEKELATREGRCIRYMRDVWGTTSDGRVTCNGVVA